MCRHQKDWDHTYIFCIFIQADKINMTFAICVKPLIRSKPCFFMGFILFSCYPFSITRISGRYAPFILAPAEGLPSCACKGSLRLLTLLSKGVTMYTTIYITERIICNYQLFPFFPFSNCQIFPLTS